MLDNNKDIYNIRLTNKLCYNLLKDIPYYRNNTHIYNIKFKENNIKWYKLKSDVIDKQVTFKSYGSVYIDDYSINRKKYLFNTPSRKIYNTEYIKKNKVHPCILN